jgi:integrase
MKTSKNAVVKGRNNPIQDSIRRINGYPDKLIYYRVACSQFWWARVYMYGRYFFKSLKTDDPVVARKKCIEFFNEKLALTGVAKGPVDSRKFVSVGNTFLDLDAGNGSERRNYDDRNRFKKVLVPFFGNLDIGAVTNAKIMEFIRDQHKRGIKPATIKHYILVLRKVVKYAANNHLIEMMPNFPRMAGNQSITKRDYFELEEYKAVCAAAEKLAKAKKLTRGVPITGELKLLIQFMVNSFLRPSDLRVLKNEHVKIKVNPDAKSASEREYLLLTHPRTKTTDQEVITMPAAVAVYKSILELQKQRPRKDGKRGKYGKPDDYVFFPDYLNRTTMMAIVGNQFREAVRLAKITGENEQHTLYSLRHSAIMYRLMKGDVDTLTLARNARTSQAMIDKFYASRLTPMMNLGKLHSFK